MSRRGVQLQQLSLIVECTNPRLWGYGGPSWGPNCLMYVWLSPVGPAGIPCTRMPTTAEQIRQWRPLFVFPVDLQALDDARLEVEVVRHNVVADVGTSSGQLVVGQGTVTGIRSCLTRSAGIAEGRLPLRRRIGNEWIEGSVDISIRLANLPVG